MFGFELTSVPLQFLRITFTYLAGFVIELGNSTIYKKTSWGIKSKQGGHLSTYGNLLQHIFTKSHHSNEVAISWDFQRAWRILEKSFDCLIIAIFSAFL